MNQSASDLTSSVFHNPSSYLYHLISPSSFLALWHIMHELSMQVKNLRNLEAFSRIYPSISLSAFFGAGGEGASIRRQWDIFSTSKFCNPSKIMMRVSLHMVEQRRIRTFKFGRNSTNVDAKKMSQGPMILSSEKFLQLLEISWMRYGGFAMLGIVRDSRSAHMRIALHIPVFFIRFQAGITSRLSRGHLSAV